MPHPWSLTDLISQGKCSSWPEIPKHTVSNILCSHYHRFSCWMFSQYVNSPNIKHDSMLVILSMNVYQKDRHMDDYTDNMIVTQLWSVSICLILSLLLNTNTQKHKSQFSDGLKAILRLTWQRVAELKLQWYFQKEEQCSYWFNLVTDNIQKRIWLPVPVLGNEIHYPQFSESLQKSCERRNL